jgi:hypothetical protein
MEFGTKWTSLSLDVCKATGVGSVNTDTTLKSALKLLLLEYVITRIIGCLRKNMDELGRVF